MQGTAAWPGINDQARVGGHGPFPKEKWREGKHGEQRYGYGYGYGKEMGGIEVWVRTGIRPACPMARTRAAQGTTGAKVEFVNGTDEHSRRRVRAVRRAQGGTEEDKSGGRELS